MRKRKFPILPFTIAVVLLGGIAVANLANPANQNPEEQAQQQEQPVDEPAGENPQVGEAALVQNLTAVTAEQKKAAGETLEVAAATKPDRPLIEIPKLDMPDPKYNPSQPSDQWYKEGSQLEQKAEGQ